MNRYSPVPPIKGKPANNNNQKQNKNVNNNNKKETKPDKSKNKMPEVEEETFEHLDDDLDLDGHSLDAVSNELKRRVARLSKLTDYSTDESKQHMIYVNAVCDNFGGNREVGNELGTRLTTYNFVELVQRMFSKHFNASMFKEDSFNETVLFNLLATIRHLFGCTDYYSVHQFFATWMRPKLMGVWNISDKSNTFCERILSVNFHADMFKYLSSSTLAPQNLGQLAEIKQIFLQAMLGTLHNVVQRARTAREEFRKSNAVDVLQPLRLASEYQMVACVALMIQSYLVTEEENEKLNSGSEVFELLVKLLECSMKRTSYQGVNFAVIEVLEVLNKLAANDNNKQRIVDSGALPYYVQLLQPSWTEVEHAEAAHGIWTLSFKCKDRILKQDGCVKALKNLMDITDSEKVKKKVQGALWILEEQAQARPASAKPPGDASGHDDGGHVFISYQWDAKATVLNVRDRLRKAGYKVWIDEDDMSGSVLEAMAMAVEKAVAVLVCLSQKYKESPNCRTEAEYTFRLRKPIIPLRLQPGYYPDGWLGALAGSKLVFDVSVPNKYEESMKHLIKELSGHGKQGVDVVDAVVATKAPPVSHAMPPSQEKVSKVQAWTTDDVNRWLESNKLQNLKSVFSSFDGDALLEYQLMRQEAPEAFFADLSKEGISRIDRLKLSKAIREIA